MGSTKKTKSSDTLVRSTTECSILTTTTATYRSSSTSAIMASVRPQTLNVNNPREAPTVEARYFIGEALNAWRAKARCNVVPAERVQELFHELQFNPSERQISEMLQTAKMFARKGSRQWHGLTFGEFCVLAADLKRFRTSSFTPINEKIHILNARDSNDDTDSDPLTLTSGKRTQRSRHKSTKNGDRNKTPVLGKTSASSVPASNDTGTPVEVFLGGSCNPTTWRKDVAIPALESLGISFYNPQVSDWTPDLIELEHRAKEKARVLFFVMDSETRASAGAIEAAHIAGQNCQQLVLVLHPYKPDQFILNETLSHQEYIDLTRNQQMLRELVTRRGLPVLDNIPSGLQRTKEILAGIRDPPSNIASILIVVRGAFDRVNAMKDHISLDQCQRALSILGYAQSLLTMENLKSVIISQRESLDMSPSSYTEVESPKPSMTRTITTRNKNILKKEKTTPTMPTVNSKRNDFQIDFDQFCILAAYLSVLQQEIHESGCISPIKGTNVPPPPVYLANLQGFHCRPGDDNITINFFTKHIFKTSSSTSVPGGEERHSDIGSRNRDSGTSSPQPSDSMGVIAKSRSSQIGQCSKMLVNVELMMSINNCYSENNTTEEESDSNDSVFSSSDSSINSVHCSGDSAFSSFEIRDVYLGGSCFLRTKWRQNYAIPYLKSKKITFHLPALHESIQPSQLDLPEKSFEDSNSQGAKAEEHPITAHCTLLHKMERKKAQNNANDDQTNHVESTNWPLNIRPNLYNPSLMDSSRVLLFVITNETRSLAPMTLAAHCIGLMYNVVLCVQMLPENCVLGQEKLTPTAIKDYNRGRSYLIDLAKRQGVPVFNDLKSALECTAEKIKALKFQKSCQTNDINSEEKKGVSCPQTY